MIKDYDDHVFRRGILISDLDEGVIRSVLNDTSFPQIKKWEKTYFGPTLKLWYDPILRMARRDTKFASVAIFGIVVNPYDGLSGNECIAEELIVRLTSSMEKFRDYVDELTGSFLILVRQGADVFVQQDAAATKTFYYHKSRNGNFSASVHAPIVAALHNLTPSNRAKETWESETYKADPSRYLPGITTPFCELFPLSANTELDITKRQIKRFFPRTALKSRDLDVGIVTEVSEVFRNTASLIAAMDRPICLATTGGKDSRVSLAAFSRCKKLIPFSFHYPEKNHLSKDVEVAKKLVSMTDHKLDIYDLDYFARSSGDFLKSFLKHSVQGIWSHAALSYIHNFPDDAIHIRSTVSEIGRAFYKSRGQKKANARAFGRTYTSTAFGSEPWVIKSIQDFFDLTQFSEENLFNYDLYDMFYWEHRNAKWQNVLCVEAEMASDVFIPYNNRRLLQTMMSLSFEDRIGAKLHLAVIDELRPDFSGIELV